MRLLTRAEELALISVWRLQDEAYSVKIREVIAELSGKEWAFGAIFVTLDRLVNQGLVISYLTEPISERGGRSKRIYKITETGLKAMIEIKEYEKNIWDGIPEINLKKS